MKLIDSNIIIYASKPGFDFLHPMLAEIDVAVSVISQVETLGYHRLLPDEKLYLGEFFDNVDRLPISESVIDKATELRQSRKVKLGDSLIAATALVHSATLVTRNLADFDWIPGLVLLNPLESVPPEKIDLSNGGISSLPASGTIQ